MSRPKRWKITGYEKGVAYLELTSWKYFYDFIHQRLLDYPGYIWRGHGSADWELHSTLERKLAAVPKKQWHARTDYHLQNFKLASRGRRGDNPPALQSDNEWWALGQHHGLATPLLDWTVSPFVALYFAFQEPAPTPKGPRAVFALHEESAKKAGVELINPLMDENKRLVNQSGLFTRSPDDKTIMEAIQDKHEGYGQEIIKIVIPNRERVKCLATLSRMNINHATLFPDLFGAGIECNVQLDDY